jgi:hypothetical protein
MLENTSEQKLTQLVLYTSRLRQQEGRDGPPNKGSFR